MARKNSVIIGDSFTSNSGDSCKVIEVLDSQNIKVIFDGYSETHTFMAMHLRLGRFKNLMKPNIAGVGYIGIGSYDSKYKNMYNICPYTKWSNTLKRCYLYDNQRNLSYLTVPVDEHWHNFQNFAQWFDSLDSKGYIKTAYELEKDILSYPNKSTKYSSDNCSFVPRQVNLLFIDPTRNLEDRGITFHPERNKWVVQCSNTFGFKKHVGWFDTKEDAAISYKLRKALLIDTAISIYSKDLDPRVLDKMYLTTKTLRGC